MLQRNNNKERKLSRDAVDRHLTILPVCHRGQNSLSLSLSLTVTATCFRSHSIPKVIHFVVINYYENTNYEPKYRETAFLVADTRLYTLPSWSIQKWVTFLNCKWFFALLLPPNRPNQIVEYLTMFIYYAYSKQSRMYGNLVADGWAGAVGQRPLEMQNVMEGLTDRNGKVQSRVSATKKDALM